MTDSIDLAAASTSDLIVPDWVRDALAQVSTGTRKRLSFADIHAIGKAARRDAEAEAVALRATIAEAREILAHTVMGSLPDDWPLKDVAEARLHDMIDLRNQVRDTCIRAEKAEAKLAAYESVSAALGGAK